MGDWIDIHTQNDLPYIFIPVTSGAVKLKVKTNHGAFIALTDGPFKKNPMTEILFGASSGCGHVTPVIRRDGCETNEMASDWIGLLRDSFIELWISWHNNEIMIGTKGEPAFMKYLDLHPHPINHIGVRTGIHTVGHWKIEVSPLILRSPSVKRVERGELRWVKKTPKRRIPPDAFIGGYLNGEVIYIARAKQRCFLLPGKYVPSKECAYIGFGIENPLLIKHKCEILCGLNASWVKTTDDRIPPNAFVAGFTVGTCYQTLFIGRARIDGHLIPGKVHRYNRMCYVPYQDSETEITEYEILVVPDKLPDAVVRCECDENPIPYDINLFT